MSRTTVRPPLVRPVRGLLALTVALLGSLLLATPAQAADAYRFWSYYQLNGATWAFAQTGPDGSTPKDGSVEGYRYALGDMATPRLPRATVTFDQVCGSTPAADGKKRVAVVVDFGRAEDAAQQGAQVPEPYAACASVPADATGTQVLQAVSQVRVEKAMVCGIDGYPATGCSETVKEVPAPAKAADQPVTIAVKGTTASAAATASPAATTSTPAASEGDGASDNAWMTPTLIAVIAGGAVAAWYTTRKRNQR